MTSVKDVRVDAAATRDAPGRGRFVFSDDYSVFDWGRMPDQLPEKGAVLCTMGAFNFELLEAEGVPTHYRGVLAERSSAERASGDEPRADDPVSLDDVERAPREMAIDLVQVPDLPFDSDAGYDYDAYHAGAGENYLVPLEVVFRNTVPVGSSLRSRGTPTEYGLDADVWPDDPVRLPEPVVEFSTKYEEQDRYLTREEADAIAGDADIDDLEALALDVNRVVTEQAEETGFDHQDGKIECASLDGHLVVADVAGTFDENRFSYHGQQVSKEVVRQFYKAYDLDWVAAVSDAKAEADERGIADWRTLVDEEPEPLPADVLDACAALYTAGANAYTSDEWFDAPDIGDAVDAVHDL